MSIISENHDDTVNGMIDHAGLPAKRSQSGYWRSARYIIGVGATERFAYYGISCNLISYLTGPLGQSTAVAAASINIWSGTGLLMSLLGGFVADSWLGRYRIIVLSSLLYILALGLLTASAFLNISHGNYSMTIKYPHPTSLLHVLFFYASLYLMALAQGAHKPCIMSFGADQFNEEDPIELRSWSSFFNWWYFGLTASPLSVLLVLHYIQDNVSWVIGFGIPCVVMAIALVIFLVGAKSYRYSATKVNAKGAIVSSVGQVFRKKEMIGGGDVTSSTKAYEEEEADHVPRLHYQEFENLNKPLLSPNPSTDFNNNDARDAKSLLKLLPIWATSLSFALVLAHVSTLFTKQSVTTNRTITSNISIPAASLQYAVGLTIMLFVPIYDRLFVLTTRLITEIPCGITKLQRIGTGMFLSTLCMIVAALVETKRLETTTSSSESPNMSFWWLVPQYVLHGISGVFALISLQELFYEHVPRGLKSVGLSLYLSIIGMGCFVSSFMICVIQKSTSSCEEDGGGWFSDDMSKAHLDYFYWLIAGLNGVSFVGFLCFAKSFGVESDDRETSNNNGIDA